MTEAAVPASAPVDPAVPVAVPADPVVAPPLLVDLPLPERIVLEELFDMEQKGWVSTEDHREFYPYLDEDDTFLSASAMEGTKGNPTVFDSAKTFADFEKFYK